MKVITGPTGSGKTEIAAEISDRIFSADAYQFYKELPILSAQPKLNAETKEKFQFVAYRSIKEPIKAGDFSRETLPYLKSPGLWAGVGLYLEAAIYGLDAERKKGTPFQGEPRVPFRMVVLHPDRKNLYERLDQRVDQMLKSGALDEARAIWDLLQKGEISEANPTLKAIGLKHLMLHFSEGLSFDETLRLWKRDTRRLAKRQLTWLRKFHPPSPAVLWLEGESLTGTNERANLKKVRDFLDSIE